MIVLDTNVVSELLRPRPDARVVAWWDAQVPDDLWLTSVVAAELMFGVARMIDGRRKQQVAHAVSEIVGKNFSGRVLAFDLAAATTYAALVSERERIGLPVAMADAQIAAISLVHSASLATRNQKHFEGMGLSLVDPWDGAANI